MPEGDGGECGFTNISGCVSEAIDSFLVSLVTPALNRFLDLLAATLLTTPTPEQLPRIGQLWESSWQIVLTVYGTLILAAAIVVMAHETLQSRTSLKEVLPRIMAGFLTGALSLWIATQAITLANALARSFLAGGVDEVSAAHTLKMMIYANMGAGFIVILGLVLAVMLAVVLLTYVVRVVLTIVLIAGAPLLLMFHALPETEGIARWWWKAFGGCLAVQLIQSFVLVTALRVFLAPGFTLLGPDTSGVVNMLVAIALMWILIKVPFWVFSSLRVSNRRSILGTLVRGVILAKTFGALRGLSGTAAASATRRHPGSGRGGPSPRPGPGPTPTPGPGPRRRRRPQPGPGTRQRPRPQPEPGPGPSPGAGSRRGPGPVNPYSRVSVNSRGQYLLPLTGVRRGTRPPPPELQAALLNARYRPPAPPVSRPPRARQLMLPADGEWPENKPVLQRDGQYRLPITTPRRPRPATPPVPPSPPARRVPAARQRPLPLDLPRVRPPRPGPRS